eukprot:m.15910 g.15910  ORF g.15910 m.15910 type:complete len:427 (-) comp7916_c0_seq1:203-1483(-)
MTSTGHSDDKHRRHHHHHRHRHHQHHGEEEDEEDRIQIPNMTCDLPRFDLSSTPSHKDGVSAELEEQCRVLGCEIIQSTGILLRCSQAIMACAQILYHRFFCRQSFISYRPEYVALGCLFLATKVEDDRKRLRHVINVSRHVMFTMSRGYKEGLIVEPLELGGDEYHEMKTRIIKMERRVLKELGFCVHLHHPHKLIVSIQGVLKIQHEELGQRAWNYMNDSLRTTVFLTYPQETIACACLQLAANNLGIELPDEWLELFNVYKSDVDRICELVMEVYLHSKQFYDDVIAKMSAMAVSKSSHAYHKGKMFKFVAAGDRIRNREMHTTRKVDTASIPRPPIPPTSSSTSSSLPPAPPRPPPKSQSHSTSTTRGSHHRSDSRSSDHRRHNSSSSSSSRSHHSRRDTSRFHHRSRSDRYERSSSHRHRR